MQSIPEDAIAGWPPNLTARIKSRVPSKFLTRTSYVGHCYFMCVTSLRVVPTFERFFF